ncbi:UBC-like protein [Coniochaeta ligniaria NRRL 30616]|uniref:UBC-like protein n=1 Tax=Coniochaeta ligniaria NRRL 30616 TaxID=1408157 RepID=A0A1J7IY66_9PEZI|nr:UBC-like protein [Coniochaeta ligniaria NRRL 30616]
MATLKMTGLPAMRRQHLLAEFSGLKQVCPDGVFVSLTPGDPMLWSGVIFVRKGPYAPAILRFHISFTDTYPSLPPLVTFSTDIFHPLITPLTTYVHTTDITDSGTVSATDEERLPPGGFSLRHGFPAWFGRATTRSRQTSGQHPASSPSASGTPPPLPPRSTIPGGGSHQSTPESKTSVSVAVGGSPSASLFAQSQAAHAHPATSTYDVLRYLASTFDSEAVLDGIPLEAAGNPGAWHAWRSRQRAKGRGNPVVDVRGEVRKLEDGRGPTPRKPGEWNWEGVWEERVKRGVQASLSEAVLFGQGQGDEVINFLNMDEGDVRGVKDNLLRTLGAAGAS